MLTIDRRHWAQLIAAGLEVVDLDERQVQEAMVLMRHHRGLSAEDGCSLVLARSISGSIVLSADAQSRAICERSFSLQAHDVLWTIDQLLAANAIATARLVQCLEAWRDDPMCHIPTVSIQQILRRINGRE